MCSTPPNIAVKRYFEWVLNAAFDLQFLEGFNTLPRRLDLQQVLKLENWVFKGDTMYLNRNISDSRDNIQRTVQHTIVREGRVKLPYGHRCFHGSNLCDMGHHVNFS